MRQSWGKRSAALLLTERGAALFEAYAGDTVRMRCGEGGTEDARRRVSH